MLVQLEAEGFRNLEPLVWRPEAGAHLILGANGAGKTSLLEAVYVLATTRSFRTPQIADCRRHGAKGFHLRGEVEGQSRARLELSWWQGERRRALNDARSSLAEHLAPLPVICWTAAESEVLTGPPGERRRFLDRGVVGIRPRAIGALARYRQALEGKRQLLAGGSSGGQLTVWNQVLAEAASELVRLRAAYVEELARELAAVLAECEIGIPRVALSYRPSPSRALEGTEALEAELAAAADRERQLRRPLLGPHRDELEIRWAGRPVRRVASAGERKALGLALLAAQGRTLAARGRSPTFLLDDADTELDPRRLAAVWRAFRPAGQLFATSNRPAAWEQIELSHHWLVERGRLRPEDARDLP